MSENTEKTISPEEKSGFSAYDRRVVTELPVSVKFDKSIKNPADIIHCRRTRYLPCRLDLFPGGFAFCLGHPFPAALIRHGIHASGYRKGMKALAAVVVF